MSESLYPEAYHSYMSFEDIEELKLAMANRAQENMKCKIVSKPYVVPNKKSVELKVPRRMQYPVASCLLDNFDEIIEKEAEATKNKDTSDVSPKILRKLEYMIREEDSSWWRERK